MAKPKPTTGSVRATNIVFVGARIVVDLSDGRTISVPITWYPRLRQASISARDDWQLIGGGIGIHWPQVDEDISVRGLLSLDEGP